MKCPPVDKFPYVVKVGSVTTNICHSTNAKGYSSLVISYYVNGRRQQKTFAESKWDEAYEYAKGVCLKLSQGEIQVANLTAADRTSYGHAVAELGSTGVPLELAAKEYAEAHKILAGRTSLVEAARFYASRHQDCTVKDVAEAVEEMLACKKQEGSSEAYLHALRVYLGKLKHAFSGPIGTVSTREIADFLREMPVSNRSRKNARGILSAFFSFCRERAWISRDDDPMADVPVFKAEARDVSIYTPAELSTLLSHARSELIPFLTIAAFAGLRSAELQRLEWSDIALEDGFITVGARKAKTASRRVVPIPANLKAWLMPYFQKSGPVVPFENLSKQLGWLARDAGVKWKKNALRHSFCSYRLAMVKDSGKVAYEAGNSAAIIYRHYHELVRPADAKSWFNIETAYAHSLGLRS